MSPVGVITYFGRFESAQTSGVAFSDTTPGRRLVSSLRSARGAHIMDPMSFPWELTSPNELTTPLVVDISRCSDDDLIALIPMLRSLTSADAILGDPRVVAGVCIELGIPDLWQPEDLDIEAFAEDAQWSKRANVEERRVVERLGSDPELTISVIDGAQLRSVGFAEIVNRLVGEDDGARVDAIWGIHPYPGRAVDRAVIAVRRRRP